MRVVLRVVPQGGAVMVLSALVSSAAEALAPFLTSALGVGSSQFLTGLVSVGLSLVGSALINALISGGNNRSSQDRAREVFSVSGWQNEVRLGDPLPCAFGRHRYAPPYAAQPYTEIVGDQQYVRGLFTFGYGPLTIEDIRLGDTSIDEFSDIQYELREGRAGDDPVALYPQQVLEDQLGVELIRPVPVDAAGDPIDAPNEARPITRQTANDAAFASVILVFPSGLFAVTREGNLRDRDVEIRIRQRPSGGTWQDVETLHITAAKRETFFRQHTWQLPTRGRWDIEVERLTDDRTGSNESDRVTWMALQSIRPEYPVNTTTPLALLSMRIRATYQLNGPLDNVNAVVTRLSRAPDAQGAWIETASRNPAAAFVAMLTGPQTPFPVADADIDWDLMADWHDWCDTKGLRYDRVHDSGEPLGDALRAIARAGRASPRHDGLKWGVVIDRPDALVVDHISRRNTDDLRWERTYVDPPDGLRVPFFDETNDWKASERIVPWIGKTEAEVILTEELSLPGKTHPDEIWIEARRVMYETAHRRDAITGTQQGRIRVATRGDAVMASLPMLDRDQSAAVVTRVEGPAVELDGAITMQPGTDYGIRFRVFADATDTVGQSVLVPLVWRAGPSRLVTLETGSQTPLQTPIETQLVHVGPLTADSLACRVQAIEPTDAGGAVLRLIPAAPIIDTLTDAEVPPAWNASTGTTVTLSYDPPLAPIFSRVFSGSDGALLVELAPDPDDITPLLALVIEHRLQGATTWSQVVLPVSQGGSTITPYARNDAVELRAFARALDATDGAPTVTIPHVIGSGAAALPAALEDASITVTGGIGHVALAFTVSDTATDAVLICRVPAGDTLDTTLHAIGSGVAVTPGLATSVIDGDPTRSNLLADPGFDGTGWTASGGWTVSGSEASHLPGTDSALSQPFSPDAAATYRAFVVVTGASAGDVTPGFDGGSATSGAAVSGNGIFTRSLAPGSGNASFVLTASAGFDGALQEAGLYLVTAACAPPGAFDYYLVPLNSDGVEGPPTTPFATTIL